MVFHQILNICRKSDRSMKGMEIMGFEDYLRELKKIDLLGRQEEECLWEAYKQQGNMKARRKLIEAYQPLVFKIATPFRHMSNIMDVIQEGTVGLIEATEVYDHRRDVAFSVFATHRIRGRMNNFLRKEGRADIACLEDYGENGYNEMDRLVDTGMAVAEIAELHEMTGRVRQALERLPEKERLVLDQVYIQSREAKKLAADMDLSTSHIYRLQKNGIRRIRGILSNFMHYWK